MQFHTTNFSCYTHSRIGCLLYSTSATACIAQNGYLIPPLLIFQHDAYFYPICSFVFTLCCFVPLPPPTFPSACATNTVRMMSECATFFRVSANCFYGVCDIIASLAASWFLFLFLSQPWDKTVGLSFLFSSPFPPFTGVQTLMHSHSDTANSSLLQLLEEFVEFRTQCITSFWKKANNPRR